MKKIVSVVLALAMLFSLAACAPSEKVYDSGKGFKITLTGKFEEDTEIGYDYVLYSAFCRMSTFKEPKSDFGDGCTLDEYAGYVYEASADVSPSEFKKADGLLYTEFEAEEDDGETYSHIAAVFEGSDNFWLAEFYCHKDKYDSMKPKIIKWLNTVEVE